MLTSLLQTCCEHILLISCEIFTCVQQTTHTWTTNTCNEQLTNYQGHNLYKFSKLHVTCNARNTSSNPPLSITMRHVSEASSKNKMKIILKKYYNFPNYCWPASLYSIYCEVLQTCQKTQETFCLD